MTGVPAWSAARSGLLGDPGAVDASAQVNQLLGTHAGDQVYVGSRILTPNGSGGSVSLYPLNAYDVDQPFTLSGTSIGRVAVPLLPVGAGSDLIVSLCTDNAGAPDTVLTQTRIPASWITQLAATAGSVGGAGPSSPYLHATGNPLATAQSNTFTMGAVVLFPWNTPTPTGGASSSFPGMVTNGQNVILFFGGLNAANDYVGDCATILYAGGQALNAPVPQAAMPTGNGTYAAAAVTIDPSSGDQYVVIAGGETGNSGSFSTVATVYAAGLNPATGALSSWSAQTSLPQALQTATAAASGNFVYVAGGVTPSNTILDTVYWASVANGQISAWNTGPALPVPVYSAYTVVSNGFLFVIGGFTATGRTGPTAATWYAPILADGSLGTWQAGPPMPYANTNGGGAYAMTMGGEDAILLRGWDTQGLFSLPVSATGPGHAWQQEGYPGQGSDALFPAGSGQWYWFEGFNSSTQYISAGFLHCPYISVPLPAAGLTSGATYHLLLASPTAGLNDYLLPIVDFGIVFPGNPLSQHRAKGSATWAADSHGEAVPLTIYDNSNGTSTPGDANNQVWHTWEDSGARITTLVRATTPDRRMLGVCEATAQPGPVLNSNPVFTSGTAPWRATGGALTQSSAQTHGSLPYSGLLTPTGSASVAAAECEPIAIALQHPYAANAWVYSPTGYADVDIQINWYSAAGWSGLVSSSAGATTSVPAGVWTPLSVTVSQPPNTALYATVSVAESGTPPSTALLYVSAGVLQDGLGAQVASVGRYTYAGTWPGSGLYPPLSFEVLA